MTGQELFERLRSLINENTGTDPGEALYAMHWDTLTRSSKLGYNALAAELTAQQELVLPKPQGTALGQWHEGKKVGRIPGATRPFGEKEVGEQIAHHRVVLANLLEVQRAMDALAPVPTLEDDVRLVRGMYLQQHAGDVAKAEAALERVLVAAETKAQA